MKKKRIRPIAICLFRHQVNILVHQGFDPVKQEYFYRPLGGGVDFGETSHDAVIREIREELGAAICNVSLVGILESVFTFQAELGHEIVFVYDGEFVDRSLYDQPRIQAIEGNQTFEAEWRSLSDLRQGPGILVPEPLWTLL
ncbi:MAG: NUDIX hydrolase [Leptolyngbyaceae bacterium]|nr:NUDIX hydrolase [Leptolyngbyaceae bacterium]